MRKIFCMAMIVAVFLFGESVFAESPLPSELVDGDYMTVSYDEQLTITEQEPIAALYIIWNEQPSGCLLTADGIPLAAGESGFLHELVELDVPAKKIIIDNPEQIGICEIYTFRDNSYPDFVQQWQPPCERADILLFSTHADDEHLMFGGTMPYYAGELDLSFQVAYLTNHEQEQPRPHELLDGLWAVGVENYPIIGIAPDIKCWTLNEAFGIYDEDALLDWTVEQIRRFRPQVVITHDKNGEYGHGAHKLCSYLVMQAAELTADGDFSPETAEQYGVWDVPKIYLHFWEENAITMDWEQPLDYFGGMTALEAARLGYSYHRSQHIWGYSVGYAEQWDCRQFGLYRSLVGADSTADFMDNLTAIPQETAPPETTEITTTTETTTTEAATTEAATIESTTTKNPLSSTEGDRTWVMGVLFFALAAVVILLVAIASRRKRK